MRAEGGFRTLEVLGRMGHPDLLEVSEPSRLDLVILGVHVDVAAAIRTRYQSRGLAKGEVKPGHVLIARNQGVRGGPGMAGGAASIVFAVDGAGLGGQIAFITDGQLSGLCN